jgi:hypothetical protein
MPSILRRMNSREAVSSQLSAFSQRCMPSAALLAAVFAAGCTYVPNHFQEQGPSATAQWDSPTAADVKARYAAAPLRQRGWTEMTLTADSGAVEHLPLYFEDPFEDKGDGRTDETDPHNVYRGGWEDYVALPYCFARFTGNWLMFPVSAIVTTPWTIMESDGRLSRQLLGYDHDAIPNGHHVFESTPAPHEAAAAEPAPPENASATPEPPKTS